MSELLHENKEHYLPGIYKRSSGRFSAYIGYKKGYARCLGTYDTLEEAYAVRYAAQQANPRTENISGQRFGRLTVVCKSNKKACSNYLWECVCDCGNTCFVRKYYLQTGKTKSCGCLIIEASKENLKEIASKALPTGEALIRNRLHTYKKSAATRGLTYELPDEVFRQLISQNCSYCGCEPRYVESKRNSTHRGYVNGIDRIDSSKGYTVDNCVTCCSTCNMGKRTMTPSEFVAHCQNVSNYSSSNPIYNIEYSI